MAEAETKEPGRKNERMTGGYVYMLRCCDGSLYTGWTNDLEKRVQRHSCGEGGKYTRSHRPLKLAYFEVYTDRHSAMCREAALKKFSKPEKEDLLTTLSKDRRKKIEDINRNLSI